jgi:hypothetical protein
MSGALNALITDKKAFDSITSFTNGLYGCITAERHPFPRMINIVNKGVWLEITYYQLANIQPAITDAMRYSENRLREHMGMKNKLHIMGLNPEAKRAIDKFFDENYPSMPTIDRRRRAAKLAEEEPHEYDKLYDVPRSELSPERALEIERESWDTTKILTEAFTDDECTEESEALTANAPELIIEPIIEPVAEPTSLPVTCQVDFPMKENGTDLFGKIKAELGEVADFIELCKNPSPTEQRRFAATHSLSADEIADKINECAANIFGDIVLEDVGGAYGIIEDYIDQF